jgi:diadenosine tetraphosphate (Ap4A) HIT family hydrolase
MNCPFCTLPSSRIVKENDLAVLVRDAYPVSPGHSLVIPKRHIGSWFEATEEERTAMLALIDEAKAMIDAELAPNSYNIGINDGPAAGQTVPHLHMHLIPRFEGDVPDPRGGVRWVIASEAKYWGD